MKQDRLPIFSKRLSELKGNRNNIEFAESLGISRQTAGFYLNGERVPDAENLKIIAERCNVSADWLLGISDVKKVNPERASVCEYTGLSENAVSQLVSNSTNREVINLLLENEYMITQRMLNSVRDFTPIDSAVIWTIYKYLTLDIPKTLVCVNDSGEVMAVDGASRPIDWLGKGDLIEMDRVAERIALEDLIRSIEQFKAEYRNRKDAE